MHTCVHTQQSVLKTYDIERRNFTYGEG